MFCKECEWDELGGVVIVDIFQNAGDGPCLIETSNGFLSVQNCLEIGPTEVVIPNNSFVDSFVYGPIILQGYGHHDTNGSATRGPGTDSLLIFRWGNLGPLS